MNTLVLFSILLCMGFAYAGLETPMQANEVADYWCVTTFFGENDTIADLMKQIGFRTFRGEPWALTNGMEFANWMGTKGFRTIVLIRPTDGATTTTAALQQKLDLIANASVNGTTLLEAIEGPNEPNIMWDINHWSYNGQGWPAGVKPMQTDIWNMVKSNPHLKHLPVLGPAWAQSNPNLPYAKGELAPICDWGNFHPYPTNNCFQAPVVYDNMTNYFCDSSDPINTYGTGYSQDPYVYRQLTPMYVPNPLAMTETGYTTIKGGISERVQGKYIPRLLLENILQGYKKSCIYELVDVYMANKPPDPYNVEENWGLIRWDLSVKPAGVALGHLTHLIDDPGADFQTRELDLTIDVTPVDGFTKTEWVHHLLVQKRNGDYYLILWHEIALMQVFDSNTRRYINPFRELFPPDLPCKITVGTPMKQATIYSWDENGVMTSAPGQLYSNGRMLNTAAQDRVRVIVFSPQ